MLASGSHWQDVVAFRCGATLCVRKGQAGLLSVMLDDIMLCRVIITCHNPISSPSREDFFRVLLMKLYFVWNYLASLLHYYACLQAVVYLYMKQINITFNQEFPFSHVCCWSMPSSNEHTFQIIMQVCNTQYQFCVIISPDWMQLTCKKSTEASQK